MIHFSKLRHEEMVRILCYLENIFVTKQMGMQNTPVYKYTQGFTIIEILFSPTRNPPVHFVTRKIHILGEI